MIAILTIARHEITRRWPLWVIGFGLGFLPLLFTASSLRTSHPSQLSYALLVLGVVMSWVVAFATGMSLVGKPLHDGRLSFYFTRPIRASAIAGGKILGGLVAIVGMQVVLALPMISLPDIAREDALRIFAGLGFIGAGFMATGLVVGILARSRSRWFAVDALGATLTATATVGMLLALAARKSEIVRTMDYVDARDLLVRAQTLLWGLAELAAVVFVGAVIVAVAIGRTDRERVHRALSLALWPAMIVVALLGLAYAHWGLQ